MAYAENLFNDFIRELERSNISVGADSVLRIQQVFHLQNIQTWEDLRRSQNLIGPIVSRSKEEQARFTTWMNELVLHHVKTIRKEEPTVISEINLRNKRAKWLGWGICAAVLLVGLFFIALRVYQDEPKSIFPTQAPKIIIAHEQENTDELVLFALSEDSFQYTKFVWDFGDKTNPDELDGRTRNASHTYTKPGTYKINVTAWIDSTAFTSSSSIVIQQDTTCHVNTRFAVLNDRKPNLDIELVFQNTSSGKCITHYDWNFGDQTGIERQEPNDSMVLTHRFTEVGTFHVVLKAYTPDTFYTYERDQVIVDKAGHIALAEFQPIFKKRETITIEKHQLYGLVLALFILLAILPTLYVLSRFLIRKRQLNRVLEKHFNDKQTLKQPYRYTLAETGVSVHADNRFAELAQRLQLHEKSDSLQLDMSGTLHQTIQQAGFPKIVFDDIAERPNYVVLIDTGGSNNQQFELFKKLLETLGTHRMRYVVFHFSGTMQTCFNADWPDGISIEKIALQYGSSRLLVYSDGYSLMNDYTDDGLVTWASRVFAHWKNKALLTPVFRYNWDEHERNLLHLFRIYPANIHGHLLMAQDFNRGEYHLWPRSQAKPWLYPFQGTIRNYKKYFSNTDDELLYRWLVALAIPEKATWENTLLVGHAIEAKYCKGSERLVTYDQLLKLTSISWLQDGQLTPKHRSELYAELQQLPDNQELIATINKELLIQVEKLNPPKDSAAALEQKIQLALLRYQLRDNPKKVESEELHYLSQQGLLSGFAKKTIYTIEKGYSRFSFSWKDWIVNASFVPVLALLFILFGDSLVAYTERVAGIPNTKQQTDSLAWYTNRAAELIQQTRYTTALPDEVDMYLSKAARMDTVGMGDDTLAHNRLLSIYHTLLYQYQENDFNSLLMFFDDTSKATTKTPPATGKPSLATQMLRNIQHLEGVCRFYIEKEYLQQDSTQLLLQQLQQQQAQQVQQPQQQQQAQQQPQQRQPQQQLSQKLRKGEQLAAAIKINEQLLARKFYDTYPDAQNNLNTLLRLQDSRDGLFELDIIAKGKQQPAMIVISDENKKRIKSGFGELNIRLAPNRYVISAIFDSGACDTTLTLTGDMRITLIEPARVVSQEAQFCYLNGQFTFDPKENEKVDILVRNTKTNTEVGIYNVDEKGGYFMALPNGGEFSFLVSNRNKEGIAHAFSLTVEKSSSAEAITLRQEMTYQEGKLQVNMLNEKPKGSGNFVRYPLAVTEIKEVDPASQSTTQAGNQTDTKTMSINLEIEVKDLEGSYLPNVEIRDITKSKILGTTDEKGAISIIYEQDQNQKTLELELSHHGFKQRERIALKLVPGGSSGSGEALPNGTTLSTSVSGNTISYRAGFVLRDYSDYTVVFLPTDTNGVALTKYGVQTPYQDLTIDVIKKLYPGKKVIGINYTRNDSALIASPIKPAGRIYLEFDSYQNKNALKITILVFDTDIFSNEGGMPRALLSCSDKSFSTELSKAFAPSRREQWPTYLNNIKWDRYKTPEL